MNPIFAIFEGALSPSHIIIVLIVGVLLFGRRLPEIGRSLGKGLVEFKKGMNGLQDELHEATDLTQTNKPAPMALQAPKRVTGAAVPNFDAAPTQMPPRA